MKNLLPLLFLACSAVWVHAFPTRVIDSPVPHPAHLSRQPTAHQWRQSTGTWGEHVAEQSLRRRGFRVTQIKSGAHGIDRIAYRVHPLSGKIIDAKFVEVKTSRGSLKLGETKSGLQGSLIYVHKRLLDMRSSPDPWVRDLGKQLRHYVSKGGRPFPSMSEVHHINTANNSYRIVRPDTQAVIRQVPLRHELARIARSGTTMRSRAVAQRSLGGFRRIQLSTMSLSLVRGSNAPKAMAGWRLLKGPLVVAAVSLEALQLRHELASLDALKARGALSARQRDSLRTRAIGRGVGGMVGSGAGVAVGAWAGGVLISGVYVIPGGQLLLPFSPWINSAGAFAGGMAGGWVGGMFGSSAGEYLATDEATENRERHRQNSVEQWFVDAPCPLL